MRFNYGISIPKSRIVRGRMPTMEIVNEHFARNFRIGLLLYSAQPPRYRWQRQRATFTAPLRRLAVPTGFNIVGIDLCAVTAWWVRPSLVFGVLTPCTVALAVCKPGLRGVIFLRLGSA